MTVETFGCVACGERHRDIRRLVNKARHDEWAGRPVTDLRDQVRLLRQLVSECAASGHLVTEPLRARAADPT